MASGKDTKLDIGALAGTTAPQGVDQIKQATATAPAASAQSAGDVDEITRALAAGEIDAVEAQRQLVESVVAEQLPADASPELEAAVRAEVESLLADDPTLRALLTAPNA